MPTTDFSAVISIFLPIPVSSPLLVNEPPTKSPAQIGRHSARLHQAGGTCYEALEHAEPLFCTIDPRTRPEPRKLWAFKLWAMAGWQTKVRNAGLVPSWPKGRDSGMPREQIACPSLSRGARRGDLYPPPRKERVE